MESLKRYLLQYVNQITGKQGSNYVCPICKSGKGPNGSAAFSVFGVNKEKWQCHSSKCTDEGKRGGDILDLIGIIEGIPDVSGRADRVRQIFGLSRTDYPAPKQRRVTAEDFDHVPSGDDYTKQYARWNKNLKDCPYLRGISLETLNRFNVGYCPDWHHPKSPKSPKTPRLIIPLTDQIYLARYAGTPPDNQRQYAKQKVGGTALFNVAALDTDEPVFIVEGELDALSIIDAGGQAVALGGITHQAELLARIRAKRPIYPLCLALDNDEGGQKTASIIESELKKIGLDSIRVDYGPHNDPNEALMKTDIGRMMEIVGRAKKEAIERGQDAFEAAKAEYLETSVYSAMSQLEDEIEESRTKPVVSTGFPSLDAVLEGGLHAGFYVLGAISSLGKTTFAMQIADQIAMTGKDVLIISLEMARTELMAKSISRETYLYTKEKGYESHFAKTYVGITAGHRYDTYSNRALEVIDAAKERYKQYAKHIFVHEGVGDIGVEKVREIAERHFFFTGEYPIIFVDFLQILAPADPRSTDKQNTDKAVLELKRMARDFRVPVFAISSFNRANYRKEVDLDSFKESGAIEYTSDILLGLQFVGMDEDGFNVKDAKRKMVREIELHVLKNRKGKTGSVVSFDYFAAFNYLVDKGHEN